jgi:hypothetical protein
MRNQCYTGTGVEVDNLHAAPRLGVRFGKLAVESQPLEALVTRLGQADEGIFALERQPAHETWAEGQHMEASPPDDAPCSIQPISPVPEFSTQSLSR